MKEEWLLCPICNDKTRLKVRLDTVLENFPLFCPKCKKEMATWCFSNNSFSIVEQPILVKDYGECEYGAENTA